MSTAEQMEAILDSGAPPHKMPTFRLGINPRTYQHRVVVGCKYLTVVSNEYDTKEQAADILRQLNKRYYGNHS